MSFPSPSTASAVAITGNERTKQEPVWKMAKNVSGRYAKRPTDHDYSALEVWDWIAAHCVLERQEP
jgi:hypothetical protein